MTSRAVASADIAANVVRIRERIAGAAQQAGRRPEEIRLVAAAKTVDPARVQAAIAAGIADIGENYVQEAAAKQTQVGRGARWHMIGHLQSNKAAQAVKIFDIIQTLDSPRLAAAVGRHAETAGKVIEVLLQVNTSGEEAKSGIAPEKLEEFVETVVCIHGIRVQGLMTIGRLYGRPEEARPEFRLLASLARKLEGLPGVRMRWLSMGMSHDFEVAIEEGANLVRIGTGIFGPRPG